MKYASLLLLFLLLGQLALAQQRLPTYWEANPDSLKRVLARQHTDTARLRTVQHLMRVDFGDFYEGLALLTQATALMRRLHHPAYPAYRTQLAGEHLRTIADSARDLALRYEARRQPVLAKRYRTRQTTYDRRALDSLKAALMQYDALGYQEPYALGSVQDVLLGELHQWQELQAYFAEKLPYYEQQQKPMSREYCCVVLSVCALHKSDYNQAISYMLQDAELVKVLKPAEYHARIRAIGAFYADWGNYNKAQQYLQRALALSIPRSRAGTFLALAEVQKQQGNYPAALANVVQALQLPSQSYTKGPALALRAEMLVRLHQLPAAKQALAQLQQFSDSVLRAPGTGDLHYPGYESRARYHMARQEWAQAEAAWLAAYKQPDNSAAENIHFLRELASFYIQCNQPRQALTYSLRAAAASDTLQAKQNRSNVAYYEQQAVERRQANRIASLHQTQAHAEARARRQRLWLLVALGGLSVLGCGTGLLWRLNSQKQQANVLLASQKAQIEEQAVRLSALDEAKNQFFANVSHELRTPLTLVLGPLDGLLTAPLVPLPAGLHAPVVLAHRHAHRLLELVNRILDLTKLDAGRLELRPVPTHLAPLLRRVVAQFDSLAVERRLALMLPAALPDDLHLLVDADKVEKVLTNLLMNALKHTPAGGAVMLSATLPAPDGQYVLTVRDTGPGVAPAEQARIFERYYQSPQAQAQGGTGLGLALSRDLAMLLGGSLTLESEPGQGAAFTFRFSAPAVPPPQPEAPAKEVPTAPPLPSAAVTAETLSELVADGQLRQPVRSRVLVVEDQPDLRNYVRGLLAATCEVLVAADGQEALDVLEREAPIDLLITDAMMPRLSGIDLLARLKAQPAWAGLPVLMLTARADEGHRVAALTVGVDDYLTKPFVTAELLARVQALLTRHQTRRYFAAQPLAEDVSLQLLARGLPTAPPTPARTAAEPVELPSLAAEQLMQWQAQVTPQLANPDFGPTELASLVCLSERTLYRRLGELAGLTPAAWLRELRLDHARRLLEAGAFRSVAEVAEVAGFGNVKSFSQRYTERFGLRPSAYRSKQ